MKLKINKSRQNIVTFFHNRKFRLYVCTIKFSPHRDVEFTEEKKQDYNEISALYSRDWKKKGRREEELRSVSTGNRSGYIERHRGLVSHVLFFSRPRLIATSFATFRSISLRRSPLSSSGGHYEASSSRARLSQRIFALRPINKVIVTEWLQIIISGQLNAPRRAAKEANGCKSVSPACLRARDAVLP